MSKRKNIKGFTLIEIIAVLVILAVIALIVTPLVLNVVRKAKDSANKRSVDAYGKAIELAVASYLLNTGYFPQSIDDLMIEYSGNEVVCGIKQLNADSRVYLSECTVGGKEVKDSNNGDGFYHYGNNKNYKIGDVITYNGMNFYVIEDSNEESDSVTVLKAEPLTVEEVNTYGAGHINRYTSSSVGTASDENGYGGMAYYSSKTCRYVNNSWVETGCTNDYSNSEVKHVVDTWAKDKFTSNDLKEDSLGYKARLITKEELVDNLGYNHAEEGPSYFMLNPEYTPSWVYNRDYRYWTMSPYEDNDKYVWSVLTGGFFFRDNTVHCDTAVVRPVVTILKSAIK